jgi:hypothetical protein
VRAGDVVWNPLTGEKALVLESSEETAGARMVAELAVEEGGFVPGGDHVHDNSAEHFEVLEGRIAFVVDGKEQTLGAGERIRLSQEDGTGGGTPARAVLSSRREASTVLPGAIPRQGAGPDVAKAV